jgi:hypothetical protein
MLAGIYAHDELAERQPLLPGQDQLRGTGFAGAINLRLKTT